MELFELTLNQLVEVKLLRLNKPKFNNQLLPLNGTYNSIEDLQSLDMETMVNNNTEPFLNKFQEFYLGDSSSVCIDNMFLLSSSFGKVLFCESLEALLIINNLSDKEIKLRDIKLKVSNEVLEGYESMYKKTEYTLINSQNLIVIPANQFYNQKIRLNADIMCKYSLEVDIQYTSYYFTEEFMKHSTNKIIKTITSHYFVEGNTSTVVKKYYKKFLFATNLPLKIKDKFINDNMEKCYIEINIINQSPYTLHISDIILTPDMDKMSHSTANSMILQQSNFISCLQEKDFKNFIIEPDEEVNIVYLLTNYKNMILINAYVLKVCWRNSLDSINKYINYVLKNRINCFNDLFILTTLERPQKVYFQEYFKIIFHVVNKTSKNLKLKISHEKHHDKDVEIIDIVEKEIELSDKTNFCLICKSEFKGSVFLPRIIITEENTKKVLNFDKLLNFECLNSIELI